MTLTDAQADGHACVACGEPGRAEDNIQVGSGDTGAPIWACPGRCVLMAGLRAVAQG